MDEPCPFCKSPMEKWQAYEHEDHIDTLLKCPKCGFVATFWKAQPPKKKKKEK
jgi:uncharacterized Zn finger protein